jgi:hypothetical protein
MSMLKKILLLLSSSMLMAVPTQEIKKSTDGELTKRQTIVAYTLMTVVVLGVAAGAGKTMVSFLPANASEPLKAAAFVPAAMVGAAIEMSILKDTDMLDFYKKHKWLLLGL